MKNEDLKLPKEIIAGLHNAMDVKAPNQVFSGVMNRIAKQKNVVVAVPSLQFPWGLVIAVLAVGLFFLIPSNVLEPLNFSAFNLSKINLPTISPVFWWSVIAVCLALYADVFFTYKRGNHSVTR